MVGDYGVNGPAWYGPGAETCAYGCPAPYGDSSYVPVANWSGEADVVA